MTKSIKVNTHHAYLNTEIVLSSELSHVDIIDEQTGLVYTLNGKPLAIKLAAGKHRLYNESLGEEINLEIEDAIKLGGSNIKKAFVFDENPWVFVATKDRLYATNTETNEEKVEYNLTPDEICAYSNYRGEVCDYFLFQTEQDYSIFNLTTGANVISFNDHIYSNSHLVIYKKEEKVIVFDYRHKKVLVEFGGQYSIGSKLYFVKEEKLYGLDLDSNNIVHLDCAGKVTENSILVNNYLLKLYADGTSRKRYILFSLENSENEISETEITIPFYVESLFGVKTYEFSKLAESQRTFIEGNRAILSKYNGLDVCCTGLRIEKIRTQYKGDKQLLILSGIIASYPSKSYKTPFVLSGEYKSHLNFNDVLIESDYTEISTTLNESKRETNFDKETQLLGISKSGNSYVTFSGDVLMLHNRHTETQVRIFENVFDTSSYNSAYFTSDGKNVVFVNRDKSMGIFGFDDMIKQPFEVEGSTVARYAGFNGYKPEIFIQEVEGRLPVWRDPISLKRISEADMSNHLYMSPDGKYTADLKEKTVYYNRLTKQEISIDEYLRLQKKYNWQENASEEEKKTKSDLRKKMQEKYSKDVLFSHLHEFNYNLIHGHHNGEITESQKERIKELNNSGENTYINRENNFTSLFVDILGYVCYKDTESSTEHRILIGRSVWFLNYVSFSYDSKYLAFGAKMKDDTWRNSQEGVFEIYDLEEQQVVDRKDIDNNLDAVWMTMFSKRGDVAYYDSHANAMIAYAESNYKYTSIAKGKSLLCFSPSGKYIALSDQNYISYQHHPNSEWGHQPSGNIYIYDSEDLENCQESYNDFGEGIDGTTRFTRKFGVASAAFSSDGMRLLAIGEDGVIVIRNLVSPIVDAMEEGYVYKGGSYEKHYYRRKERNTVAMMTCYMDGEVTNQMVDYWAEPDETIDGEQCLVFSEDMTELRRSLYIYNAEYKIPEGVKVIKKGAFKGRWWYYGDHNFLQTLYLPDTIECIEETFDECPSLEKIYVSKASESRIKAMVPKLANKIIAI
jgi:hypothetical protein